MKNILKKGLNLQLFAEGASGAEAGAAAAQAGNGMPATSDQQGVTVQDANAQQQTQRDFNAEFEALINGEYKEAYSQKVQNTVQRRLKGSQERLARLDAVEPILQSLGNLLGVDGSDLGALQNAIDNDNRFYEEEALEKGMDVEQFKEMKRLERQNEAFRRMQEQQAEQDRVTRNYAMWKAQEPQVKARFPQFNLDEEIANPQFIQMVESGIVDIGTAYMALHADDLIPQAMNFAAQTVQTATVNSVIANGLRPSENGLSGTAAAAVTKDVSKLTDAEMDEYIRRARNGEIINLRDKA